MKNIIVEEDLRVILAGAVDWTRFSNATVLISGANGMLPAYMVETLLYANEKLGLNLQVLALVRNEKKAAKRFAHYDGRSDLKLVVQDVCDPVRYAGRIDYIIHAASQASPKYFGVDPVGTLSANIFGAQRLLELAKQKDVQSFLYFSSGEVYGSLNPAQAPTPENVYGVVDPCAVRSCYAESKRMSETLCVCWHAQYGTPAKIVRPFHTYGPHMELDDGRVFADFVSDILANRNIVLNSAGTAQRAFCYVADATLGFFTVLLKGQAGQAYNVGAPANEISIMKLAHLLAGLFPDKKLSVRMNLENSSSAYLPSKIARSAPDIAKIKLLGWEPQTSLEEGFRRTVKSFE